jgi:class 3 adenylate cyclase
VFCTGIVRDRAKAVKFQFADRGEHPVKGYKDPIPVYEVLWDEGPATSGQDGGQKNKDGTVADAAE